MNFRVILLLLVFISKSTVIFSHEKISSAEAALLFPFFQTLIKSTEAGYVLDGKKPVCFDGFSEKICSSELSDWHQSSVALWGAKKILQRSFFQSGNTFIHFDEKEGIFFIINRKLFLDTVSDNLPLFQYVLGPCVTPQSLLEAILSPDQSFFSVLRDDNTLIGIVLGFGTQNSLFGARQDDISAATLSADIPPLRAKIELCRHDFDKKILLFFPTTQSENVTKNRKHLQPSFGFHSLAEEGEVLEKKISISSDQLQRDLPFFIFGYLKELEDNQQWICDLETTQKKIQCLLGSPTFLEDVLEKMIGEKVEVEKTSVCSSFSVPPVNLTVVFAKLLKESLEGLEQKDLALFAKGLLEEMEDKLDAEQWLLGFPECIKNIRHAKNNIEKSDHFFASLLQDPSFTSLVDLCLYYKTLEKGAGRFLDKETKVYVDFDIFDPSGKCLRAESQLLIDLEKMIPGFAHGLQGMQIGEMRELYIHPSLAYGVHTYLEKGIYLKVLVRLVDIQNSTGNLPPLVPIDLAFMRGCSFLEECEQIYQQCLACLGTSRSRFLKSWPGVDVPAVASALCSMKDEETLSKEELEALNQFFWNSYFSDNHVVNSTTAPR